MTQTIYELYKTFTERYPYVSVNKSVVAKFYKQYHSTNVDLLYDYILSQGLADEVEE